MREHDEFVRSFSALDRLKYEPGIDYGKKRGLLEEINQRLAAVEEDAALRSAISPPRGVEAGSVEVHSAAQP